MPLTSKIFLPLSLLELNFQVPPNQLQVKNMSRKRKRTKTWYLKCIAGYHCHAIKNQNQNYSIV